MADEAKIGTPWGDDELDAILRFGRVVANHPKLDVVHINSVAIFHLNIIDTDRLSAKRRAHQD
jgi:hypothetical protein